MDNYAIMRQNAQALFLTYNVDELLEKPGVSRKNGRIATCFLGKEAWVEISTGQVFVDGKPGDFGQTLTVLDWLCDRKKDTKASGRFCPVSSLPGVLVSGGTLVISGKALAQKADADPEKFLALCKKMGGREVPLGDFGVELMAFPDLPVRLKFYRADDEFPPSVTLLWDENILHFIRYETVYYLAGCLLRQLEQEMI